MPFISVHMIVKENTELGRRFTAVCLESLAQAQYPDELVIVDNGSSPEIFQVYEDFKPRFSTIKIVPSDAKDFTSLRNLCLKHTNPQTDYWHWVDSDEVYYPEDLDTLKHVLVNDQKNIRQVWTYFYHFMTHPWQVQDKCSKDNFFKYTPGVFWHGGVHEHVAGLPEGCIPVQSEVEYLHYGYVRQQWRTCVKWLHYDWIQHGHLNGYKLENCENPDGSITQKDWFRDWRHPDNILWDRNPVCKPYPGNIGTRDYLPSAVGDILLAPAKGWNKPINADTWADFVNFIDPHDFWDEWQDQHKKVGSWRETLDWVADYMVKNDWKI